MVGDGARLQFPGDLRFGLQPAAAQPERLGAAPRITLQSRWLAMAAKPTSQGDIALTRIADRVDLRGVLQRIGQGSVDHQH